MPTPGAPSPRGRWLSLDGVLSLLLGGVVIYAYATYAGLSLTRPTPDDYERAVTHIRSRFESGDLIDANPFWASRVRERIGDLPLVALRRFDSEDLTAYRRLWLFSLFGAEDRRPIRGGLAARADLLDESRFGHIDVRLYRIRGHSPVLYDFREALERARVRVEGPRPYGCGVWERGHWRCPGEEWHSVGREVFEVGEEPRDVIWAHPVDWGTLTIEFPDVPTGPGLTVSAGFLASALRYGGAPVTLSVEANGKRLLERTYEPRAGLSSDRVDTGQAPGSTQTVTFRVRTRDAAVRHFVFAAQIRG